MRQRNVSRQPHTGSYIRAWPCDCGKRGYKERRAAKDVIREMRRQGTVRSDRVDAYRCDIDPDYWHVGHRPDDDAVNLNDPKAYDN